MFFSIWVLIIRSVADATTQFILLQKFCKRWYFLTQMSGMRYEEEYLNIEDYIVKGEGFYPSPFYVDVVVFTHF